MTEDISEFDKKAEKEGEKRTLVSRMIYVEGLVGQVIEKVADMAGDMKVIAETSKLNNDNQQVMMSNHMKHVQEGVDRNTEGIKELHKKWDKFEEKNEDNNVLLSQVVTDGEWMKKFVWLIVAGVLSSIMGIISIAAGLGYIILKG